MSVGHTCPTITLEIDTLLIYSKQEVMFNLRLYTSIFGAKICTLRFLNKLRSKLNIYFFVNCRVQFFAPLTFMHLSYWIKIVQPYLLIVKIHKCVKFCKCKF